MKRKRETKADSEDHEEARDEAIMSADDTGMVRNEALIVHFEETEKLEE
jgi:hypothetical protein